MSYIPEWKGPIEGYVVNFLAREMWRVKRTHTFDEALQEAYIVFLRTAARYTMVETPEHFMALFKTSWANEFTDLSNKATAARQLVPEMVMTDEEGEQYRREVAGDLENDGMLAVMIRQAPKEVLMVLNLFLNAPQELLELAMETWRRQGKYRADGDKAVARMLGLPADSKPVTQTQDYFAPDRK